MTQKKYLTFIEFVGLLLIPICGACQSSLQTSTLKISISNPTQGFIVINEVSENSTKKDTFNLNSTFFYFNPMLLEPTFYNFSVNPSLIEGIDFGLFLEPNHRATLDISLLKDSTNYTFSGNKTQHEFDEFAKLEHIANTAKNPIDLENAHKTFILSHPDSYVSGWAIALNTSTWGPDTLAFYLSKLTPKARKYKYALKSEEIYFRKKNNSVGAPMRSFDAINHKEQPFSSEMLTGKTILLEFWASWCEPCRKSFPGLQKIIKQYHPLGLEVVGISEDIHKDAWLKAIETDSLQNWHHVLSGLKADIESRTEQKRISYQFGVTAFPTRLLVAANGNIIGRWEGETPVNAKELEDILEKVFRIEGF